MKLNKKDEQYLNDILGNLKKASDYLLSDDIAVCSRKHTDVLSYYNKSGNGLNPMNKRIGSDLTYLFNAISKLECILPPESV